MLTIVEGDLVVARAIPGGFSYTLASRLAQLLSKAETKFGPRDKSFSVGGVEFHDGAPQHWFPGKASYVVVQLNLQAMLDVTRALFQLAHECVHLLDPAPGEANTLEEGLATVFSLDFLKEELKVDDYPTGDPKYDRAVALVRGLLDARADGPKLMRQHFGPLRKVKPEQIAQICPTVAPNIVKQLAGPL
jgi:hypothetical protein